MRSALIIDLPEEISAYKDDLEFFLAAMVSKLYDNKEKGKWDTIELDDAQRCLYEEIDEMKDALNSGDMDNAFDEAVDVANMALIMSSMIYGGRNNPFGPKVRIGASYDFLVWASQQTIDFCIVWPYASKTGPKQEYGSIGKGLSKFGRRAHRVVCGLAHGDPPSEAHQASHMCGNSLCVNPKHLKWCTFGENQSHKIFHRTVVTPVKLDWSKANQMRIDRTAGATIKALSEKYDVSRTTVYKILQNKTYNPELEPK